MIDSLGQKKTGFRTTANDEILGELANIKFGPKPHTHLYISIPRAQVAQLVDLMKFELVKKLNSMISEITYGKIPQNIFRRFQLRVNEQLVNSNPAAVSELNIAYEQLGKSEDVERIAHVAFACRRLIKSIADKLYPASQEKRVKLLREQKELDISEEKFLNRLQAYVDSLPSPNSKYLLKEIALLRDFVNEIPENVNKGVHSNISNINAERLVLYTYIILGDIILETK